ncbi:MAG: CPBP family intramembrane metalloprotease [Candidatus Adiutrix sp.]|nr:CPBP family intramembrane metalloprotease [Candidatus Adiutrix sp.]
MHYTYKPFRFYAIVFAATWGFWIAAAMAGRGADSGLSMALMLLGLFVPSVTALVTVACSGSAALKHDLRLKLFGLFRVKPQVVAAAIALFGAVVAASILLSALFGQSLNQFAWVAEFSFAGGGGAALATITLAAVLEELGWRGYAEDAIAFYCSWWKESLIFGVVWALWHLPLFFIPDTYQYNILRESPWYMLNFFASIMPLGFIATWVYVKNNRSLFAGVIFHFFVNLMQEKIALTNTTKCVETFVLFAAAGLIVALNRDLFFEKRHIGALLPDIPADAPPRSFAEAVGAKRARV